MRRYGTKRQLSWTPGLTLRKLGTPALFLVGPEARPDPYRLPVADSTSKSNFRPWVVNITYHGNIAIMESVECEGRAGGIKPSDGIII
jgi:hypothetical protein